MFELRQTSIFAKWFSNLKDRKATNIIAKRLVKVEAGHFGDVKSLGDGVSELRIHFGPGYRIYYTQRGPTIVVLLSGGNKGSQARDIDRAKKLAKELDNENDEV